MHLDMLYHARYLGLGETAFVVVNGNLDLLASKLLLGQCMKHCNLNMAKTFPHRFLFNFETASKQVFPHQLTIEAAAHPYIFHVFSGIYINNNKPTFLLKEARIHA